jgi:hypothetical protein
MFPWSAGDRIRVPGGEILFTLQVLCSHMGFGSYDESEQDNQDYDTDFEDDDGVSTSENAHDGDVDYEFSASNDELLDKLKHIKEDEDENT